MTTSTPARGISSLLTKSGPPYRDGQRLPLEGGFVRLKVNRRARRISIRIDARSGEAIAIAPSERTLKEAVAFARLRQDWIAERLGRRPVGLGFEPGVVVPVRDRPVRLVATGTLAAARWGRDEAGGEAILSGGEGEAFARRIERLLKAEARQALEARTAVHLKTLGQGPVKVSIGDPGSRWGSCSPHNRSIRYSWRVIMAPAPVLDYLAAHEVAHLVHADHSPAYWAVVERLIGDPRLPRRWLREHGAGLHALGRAAA